MADVTETTPVQPVDIIDGCVSSKIEKTPVETNASNGNGHSETPNDASVAKNSANGNSDVGAKENDAEEENPEVEPELYFTPKVNLPIVIVNTMEDNEEVIVELRSRIYRYDSMEDESQFKERGTGVVKILRHKSTDMYRILMRRDKTHKICANHHITTTMELNPHNNSEKVFVYSTLADLYEGEISPETFAIRFSSSENATIFKNAFDDAVKAMRKKEKEQKKVDLLTKDLENVAIESTKEKEIELEGNGDKSDQ